MSSCRPYPSIPRAESTERSPAFQLLTLGPALLHNHRPSEFQRRDERFETPAHLAAWRTRRPKSLATTACVACAWTSSRERLRPARLLRPPPPCRALPDPRMLRRHGVEGDIGSALRHTSAQLCIPAYEYTSALHNFPYRRHTLCRLKATGCLPAIVRQQKPSVSLRVEPLPLAATFDWLRLEQHSNHPHRSAPGSEAKALA